MRTVGYTLIFVGPLFVIAGIVLLNWKNSAPRYLVRGRRKLHDEYINRAIDTYLATGVMTPEEGAAYRGKHDDCYNGDCGFCQDVYKDLTAPKYGQTYG